MANGHGGKRPGAGRKAGSKDRKKTAFHEALRAYCALKQVDPHFFMVDMIGDPRIDVSLRFQAAKEVAQYLEAKHKAIDLEVSGNADKPLTVVLRRAHGN